MIVASKSNNVVLVGCQIIEESLVASACYTTAVPDSVVRLYDVSPDLIEPVDMEYWRLPPGNYVQGDISPVIVLTRAQKPGT